MRARTVDANGVRSESAVRVGIARVHQSVCIGVGQRRGIVGGRRTQDQIRPLVGRAGDGHGSDLVADDVQRTLEVLGVRRLVLDVLAGLRVVEAQAYGVQPLPLQAQPGERWLYCYPDEVFAEY